MEIRGIKIIDILSVVCLDGAVGWVASVVESGRRGNVGEVVEALLLLDEVDQSLEHLLILMVEIVLADGLVWLGQDVLLVGDCQLPVSW